MFLFRRCSEAVLLGTLRNFEKIPVCGSVLVTLKFFAKNPCAGDAVETTLETEVSTDLKD